MLAKHKLNTKLTSQTSLFDIITDPYREAGLHNPSGSDSDDAELARRDERSAEPETSGLDDLCTKEVEDDLRRVCIKLLSFDLMW